PDHVRAAPRRRRRCCQRGVQRRGHARSALRGRLLLLRTVMSLPDGAGLDALMATRGGIVSSMQRRSGGTTRVRAWRTNREERRFGGRALAGFPGLGLAWLAACGSSSSPAGATLSGDGGSGGFGDSGPPRDSSAEAGALP